MDSGTLLDLDADGDLDFLATLQRSYEIGGVWEDAVPVAAFAGRGDGTFDPPEVILLDRVALESREMTDSARSFTDIAPLDIDGDGTAELLVAKPSMPGGYGLKESTGRFYVLDITSEPPTP